MGQHTAGAGMVPCMDWNSSLRLLGFSELRPQGRNCIRGKVFTEFRYPMQRLCVLCLCVDVTELHRWRQSRCVLHLCVNVCI